MSIQHYRGIIQQLNLTKTDLESHLPGIYLKLRTCTRDRNEIEGRIILLDAILREEGYDHQEDSGPVSPRLQGQLNRFAILERRRNRTDELKRLTGAEMKKTQERIAEIEDEIEVFQRWIDEKEAEERKAAEEALLQSAKASNLMDDEMELEYDEGA